MRVPYEGILAMLKVTDKSWVFESGVKGSLGKCSDLTRKEAGEMDMALRLIGITESTLTPHSAIADNFTVTVIGADADAVHKRCVLASSRQSTEKGGDSNVVPFCR